MLLSMPMWPQEVVSHCKKLTKKNREQLSEMVSMDKQKGLKSLSKEKRQKLEAYQHLFYLLQVGLGDSAVSPTAGGAVQGPGHRLPRNTWVSLVSLFPADTASVLGQADLPDVPEQVHQIHGVSDLYALQLRVQPTGGLSAAPALQSGPAGGDQVGVRGVPWCGDRPWEKLNCVSLDAVTSSVCCFLFGEHTHAGPSPHPICPISVPRSKVDHVHDILMGNATVIRLVVSFYRNVHGQNALRHILGGPVQEVLQDKTLSIRMDPVDIYKAWINQTESQSGHRRSDSG